ncbi:diaminopimelate epimerase [Cellulomonas sp. PhB143]|uniref:diaminopimelate epimerase n=1 Tax=Cellulomonas sp. PhB143 TaxID=2485186 RepID=UPI000F4AF04E|nr:diaminopimelate epimerase [Cellulomonas sp. PhB143]ROS77181.1 diaminopimelate epimerase [Cellulomonas sp. PhB143]
MSSPRTDPGPATGAVSTAAGLLEFVKGHGTQNDFVLIDDRADEVELTPELVRALADRRGGVGADGVIRLVPSSALEEGRAVLAREPAATWFMDYRNGDGSVAEMCGNGVRVFAAFAEHLGLVDVADGAWHVATRAGLRTVTRDAHGWYAVDMGAWSFPGGAGAEVEGADATVVLPGSDVARAALSVDLGNPHTVVALGEEAELDALDLGHAPRVDPAPPHGTNVEVVVPLGESVQADGTVVGRVRMRVHERGVGETRSCGTGACAAALAVRAWAGAGAPDVWQVEVPGGVVRVRVLADGHVELAGPARLVFSGALDRVALTG